MTIQASRPLMQTRSAMRRRVAGRSARRLIAAVTTASMLALPAFWTAAFAATSPRLVENVSVDWPGTGYTQGPRLSSNGEVVVFQGTNDVAVAAPGSGTLQVFAHDLATSQIVQVSVNSDEAGIFQDAWAGGVSADGRYVVFGASAPSVPGPDRFYLRDLLLGTTEFVDIAQDGGIPDGGGGRDMSDISDDGRFVVFASSASNLVAPGEDTNGKLDVFLRDRVLGTTTRLSVGQGGAEANNHSYGPSISGDGSTVGFISDATNLLAPGVDSNGMRDAYVVRIADRMTERVSVADDESQANGVTLHGWIDLSADGNAVAFDSLATNLVAGDTNNRVDVFVRNRAAGTTLRASVRDDGSQPGTAGDSYTPVLSADGTRVAFTSRAQLDPGKTSSDADVFLRDVRAATTELLSRTTAGSGGDGPSGEPNNTRNLAIDGAGEVVVFGSFAADLSVPPASPQSPRVLMSAPVPADADGDGITDDIDGLPGVPSAAFSDGTTFGSVAFTPAGFSIAITDAIGVDEGIHVVVTGSGTQKVQLSMCGGLTVRLPAGGDTVLTCGSVIVNVAFGSPPVEVVVGDGLAVLSVPPGAEAEIDATASGAFSVENVSGGDVTVTVDGTTVTVVPGSSLNGHAWKFEGFIAPVDNGGILNTAKAGRTVPIRWRITDASGEPVLNLGTARLTVTSLVCPSGVTADQLEEYTTGGTTLTNHGNGYYQLNWATPTAYASSCKTLHLDIGDGVDHVALFRFTR